MLTFLALLLALRTRVSEGEWNVTLPNMDGVESGIYISSEIGWLTTDRLLVVVF